MVSTLPLNLNHKEAFTELVRSFCDEVFMYTSIAEVAMFDKPGLSR